MAKISNANPQVQELQHRMRDDVLVVMRTFAVLNVRAKNAVLIVPDLGESITALRYHELMQGLWSPDTAVYLLELRGHGLSLGVYSIQSLRQDVNDIMTLLRKQHRKLYVLASGVSAAVLLEHEELSHRLQDHAVAPDGMVLLDPTFSGKELIPQEGTLRRASRSLMPSLSAALLSRLLVKVNRERGPQSLRGPRRATHYGYCRVPRERVVSFYNDLVQFSLGPVHVQTPTMILLCGNQHEDVVKRVFGNVRTRHASWLAPDPTLRLSSLTYVQHLREELDRVRSSDRPIRFRTTL